MAVQHSFNFVTNNLDKIYFLNNLLQAGASAYKKSSATAFEEVYSKETFLNFANIACIFWTVKQGGDLLLENQRIYSVVNTISTFAERGENESTLVVKLGIIVVIWSICVWCCLMIIAVNGINKQSMPNEKVVENDGEGPSITWGSPGSKRFSQGVHLTQLITCVALAVYSTSPYFYAFSAISHAYSFYSATKENWVKIRSTHIPPENVKRICTKLKSHTISYFFPILPVKTSELSKDDENRKDCSICIENDDESPVIAFHGKHTFHRECIATWVVKKVGETILNHSVTTLLATKDYREPDRYSIQIWRNSLQNCPVCREYPTFISDNIEAFSTSIHNEDDVTHSTTISVKKNRPY